MILQLYVYYKFIFFIIALNVGLLCSSSVRARSEISFETSNALLF